MLTIFCFRYTLLDITSFPLYTLFNVREGIKKIEIISKSSVVLQTLDGYHTFIFQIMRIFFNPPEKSQTRQVLLLNQPRHLDICYQEWPDPILSVIVFDFMKIYFSLNLTLRHISNKNFVISV